MAHPEENEWLGQLLFQISGQLRGPLGGMYSAMDRIAPLARREQDPKLDRDAAQFCRGYYQLLRLANNLADAAAFSPGVPLPLQRGDLFQLCRELYLRAEPLVEMRGQSLHFLFSGETSTAAYHPAGVERLSTSRSIPPPTPVVSPRKTQKKALSPKPAAMVFCTPMTEKMPRPAASKMLRTVSLIKEMDLPRRALQRAMTKTTRAVSTAKSR